MPDNPHAPLKDDVEGPAGIILRDDRRVLGILADLHLLGDPPAFGLAQSGEDRYARELVRNRLHRTAPLTRVRSAIRRRAKEDKRAPPAHVYLGVMLRKTEHEPERRPRAARISPTIPRRNSSTQSAKTKSEAFNTRIAATVMT